MMWAKGQKVWVASWRRHAKLAGCVRSEATVKSVGRKWVTIEGSSPADTERFPVDENEIDPGDYSLADGWVFASLEEREDFILAREQWVELRELMRTHWDAPNGLKPAPIQALVSAIKELFHG